MNKILLALMMVFICSPSEAVCVATKTVCETGCDYAKLADAHAYMAANCATPTEPIEIKICSTSACNSSGNWSVADTSVVTLTGITTSSTNTYTIKTYGSARHNGTPNALSGLGNYRLIMSSEWVAILSNSMANVIVDGLEIEQTHATANEYTIRFSGSNSTLKNCIIKSTRKRSLYATGGSSPGLFIYNNILRGGTDNGIQHGNWSGNMVYLYNNTVYGHANGFAQDGDGNSSVLKNNISWGNSGNDYNGSVKNTATNNASEDATAPAYNTYFRSDHNPLTIAFVNAANGDFHLASTDGAIGNGADLHADANLAFSTDIDENSRPDGSWDIGADEYVATSSGVPMATSWLISGMSISGESFN